MKGRLNVMKGIRPVRIPPRKKRKTVGAPPGSLVYTGTKEHPETITEFIEYDAEQLIETEKRNQLPPEPDDKLVHWFDLRGLNNVPLLSEVGTAFGLHPLILEDILDTSQRPKFEEFPNGFFLILQAIQWNSERSQLIKEQVSLFCSNQFVLSFQENPEDVFLPVRERLRAGRGKIRQRNTDYLAYALADNIVDHYLHVLDSIQDEIESLEMEVVEKPTPGLKNRIHHLKRAVLEFRRICLPMREAILRMQRNESAFIEEQTTVFLRDLVDNIIQVTDSIDTYRDMLNSLQDLSLSELSYRMNNVIQLLTIISTIFIPLTFLVGVYGMNFEYMPELDWRYGYLLVWIVMIVISLLLIIFFRHKRWL